MTVKTADVYRAAGTDGLIEKLDISTAELMQAHIDSEKEEILARYNSEAEIIEKWPDPVEEFDDLPSLVTERPLEWTPIHDTLLVFRALELRSDDYVHITQESAMNINHIVAEL